MSLTPSATWWAFPGPPLTPTSPPCPASAAASRRAASSPTTRRRTSWAYRGCRSPWSGSLAPAKWGWGAKSTSLVLAEYGHLEDIPLDPRDWIPKVRGKERLAESLRLGFDDALLFRELATLRLDVPIAEDLAALEWHGVPRRRFPPAPVR